MVNPKNADRGGRPSHKGDGPDHGQVGTEALPHSTKKHQFWPSEGRRGLGKAKPRPRHRRRGKKVRRHKAGGRSPWLTTGLVERGCLEWEAEAARRRKN